MAHYRVADLLGYEVTAHFPSFFTGLVYIETTSLFHDILISLAGGLFVCVFFLTLNFFTEDFETTIILVTIGTLEFFYAITETLYSLDIFGPFAANMLPILPTLVIVIPFVIGKIEKLT